MDKKKLPKYIEKTPPLIHQQSKPIGYTITYNLRKH